MIGCKRSSHRIVCRHNSYKCSPNPKTEKEGETVFFNFTFFSLTYLLTYLLTLLINLHLYNYLITTSHANDYFVCRLVLP